MRSLSLRRRHSALGSRCTSTDSAGVEHLLRTVPNDILIEIFKFLPGSDLKSLRLSNKALKDLASPLLFGTRIKIKLELSPVYRHCKFHGWYIRDPDDIGPCDGRQSVSARVNGLLGKLITNRHRAACGYFDSPAATSADEDFRDPLMGPVMIAIKSGLLNVLRFAKELRIRVSPAVYDDKSVDAFTRRLPEIFASAKGLKRVYLYANTVCDWDGFSGVVVKMNFFRTVSRLCAAKKAELHVELFLREGIGIRQACIGSLSGLSSLEMKVLHCGTVRREEVSQQIAGLLERSPLLKLPGPDGGVKRGNILSRKLNYSLLTCRSTDEVNNVLSIIKEFEALENTNLRALLLKLERKDSRPVVRVSLGRHNNSASDAVWAESNTT